MKRKTFGFTLVELLTVVAIIGILSAILIPVVGRAMEGARRMAAMTNASSIANAHQSYLIDIGRGLSPGDIQSVGDFAAKMAQYHYLESAEPFFISNDPLAPDPIPRSLAAKSGDTWEPTAQFTGVDAYSVDIAVGLVGHSAMSTTPFVWSRGLSTSGVWTEDAVWGDEEGFIIYGDGHCELVENLGDGDASILLHYSNRTPTNNVLEALPARAVVRGKGAGSLDGQSGSGR
ncbi:type II secretion system protein [Cerasicoccus frondis]|uniref:type II secretion system protein n=1 Tax=Cerasicoccus frondis TaxID=490090 RepID=UPI002852ABAB|nr:type II secretion system protein [Cerasicoccus frondis]